MRKKLLAYSLFTVTIFVISVFVLRARAEEVRHSGDLPTYFKYTKEERDALRTLSSGRVIAEKQLKKWDAIARGLAEQGETDPVMQLKIATFLYTAQREGAFLSYNTNDYFEGSLDPIGIQILRLFYPNAPSPETYQTDPYSEKLAAIVIPKFKRRLEQEQEIREKLRPPECASNNWEGISAWIPWLVKPISQFQPPPPPPPSDKVWSKELKALTQIQKKMTEKEKLLAKEWATGDAENWVDAANTYIFDNDVPLAKALLVRSVLTMGLSDALLAAWDAKYHYCTERPFALDANLAVLVPKPTSPSYPSGHATLARAGETILSFYFPDDDKMWKRMMEEACRSRLWAGVHFPIDVEEGKKLGREIGCEIIVCEGEGESS